MSEVTKSVALRLARGFVAGFVASAAVTTLGGVGTWGELATALNALVLAGVIGGITGLLLAADKYLRAE